MELLHKVTDALNSVNQSESIKELIDRNTEIQTDKNGNIIAHIKGGGGKKIMLSAVVDINRVIITSVKENSAEFELLGTMDMHSISDREVFKNGDSVGVISSKYKDDKTESQNIELWDKNFVNIGDILTLFNAISCKGDTLYGLGLSQAIPCEIALSLLNKIDTSVNDIYFTLSFSTKYAKAMAQTIRPDFIFPVYCAEEYEDFKVSDGCGVVYKDGNAVCEPWVRDIIIECAQNIKFQPYIGKCTALTEQLAITGVGPAVGGICIPIKHLNSACPIANLNDIQYAEELLSALLNYEY